jgi:hypothetical protein
MGRALFLLKSLEVFEAYRFNFLQRKRDNSGHAVRSANRLKAGHFRYCED